MSLPHPLYPRVLSICRRRPIPLCKLLLRRKLLYIKLNHAVHPRVACAHCFLHISQSRTFPVQQKSLKFVKIWMCLDINYYIDALKFSQIETSLLNRRSSCSILRICLFGHGRMGVYICSFRLGESPMGVAETNAYGYNMVGADKVKRERLVRRYPSLVWIWALAMTVHHWPGNEVVLAVASCWTKPGVESGLFFLLQNAGGCIPTGQGWGPREQ